MSGQALRILESSQKVFPNIHVEFYVKHFTSFIDVIYELRKTQNIFRWCCKIFVLLRMSGTTIIILEKQGKFFDVQYFKYNRSVVSV